MLCRQMLSASSLLWSGQSFNPMENKDQELPESSREAVHAAKNAAQAIELARQVQSHETADKAAHIAADLAAAKVQEKIIDREEMAVIIREQMISVLSSGSDHERELILARVPYICNDIKAINANIAKLTEVLGTYPVVKNLVFGGAGMILTAVVGALIALVVTQT